MKRLTPLILALLLSAPLYAAPVGEVYYQMVEQTNERNWQAVVDAFDTITPAEFADADYGPRIEVTGLKGRAQASMSSADAVATSDALVQMAASAPNDELHVNYIVSAYNHAAAIRVIRGDYQEAIALYQQMRADAGAGISDVHLAGNYMNEANAHRFSGNEAGAVSALNQAIAINTVYDASCQWMIGSMAEARGDEAAAVAGYTAMFNEIADTPDILGNAMQESLAYQAMAYLDKRIDIKAVLSGAVVRFLNNQTVPQSTLLLRPFIARNRALAPLCYSPDEILQTLPVGKQIRYARWFDEGNAPRNATLPADPFVESIKSSVTHPYWSAMCSGNFLAAARLADETVSQTEDVEKYVAWAKACAGAVRCGRLDFNLLPAQYVKFREGDPWNPEWPDDDLRQSTVNPIEAWLASP